MFPVNSLVSNVPQKDQWYWLTESHGIWQTGEVTGNDGRGKRQVVGNYDENEGQELGVFV